MWANHPPGAYEGILYSPSPMPTALADAWIEASAAGETGLATTLGGRWTPASVWRAMERMRRSDPRVQALIDAEVEAEEAEEAATLVGEDGGRRRPKL